MASVDNKKVITDNFDKDYPSDKDMKEGDSEYVGSLFDVYEKAFKSGLNVGFNRGYACACANLVRLSGDSDGTYEMFRSNFQSIKDLKKDGVDQSDIDALKKTIKYLEEKQKQNLKLDGGNK